MEIDDEHIFEQLNPTLDLELFYIPKGRSSFKQVIS